MTTTVTALAATLGEIKRAAGSDRRDADASADTARNERARRLQLLTDVSVPEAEGGLDLPANITSLISALAENSKTNEASAVARADAAEGTSTDVRNAEAQLAPHLSVRERVQAAGGMAGRAAYDPTQGG